MVEKVLTASFETLRGLSQADGRISIQSQKVLRQQRLVLRFLTGCFLWMTLCVCFWRK